jgi:glucose-1-phosphate adenylyltransferase
MGLLLAGQETNDIRGLTKQRPIASIPFAGRYRVVDFALTNLTRTGIKNVGILVPFDLTRSLRDHIRGGQFWDLNRKDGGMFLMPPTVGTEMGKDTLASFKSNLEYLHKSKEDTVIVYPSHLIANIDMKEIIESHENSGKDVTVVYKKVNKELSQYNGGTSVIFNEKGEIDRFGSIVDSNEETNVSLEIKIINKEVLIELLMRGVQNGYSGDANRFIEFAINKISSNSFEFKGYAKFINTTRNYISINNDLLNKEIRNELLLSNGGISTKINDTPPAVYEVGSKVSNSLVANGCLVSGTIKNSIIGRRVVIEEGVTIENCIILQSCTIKKGAELKHVIMDKNTVIKKYEKISGSNDFPVIIEKKSVFEI